MCQVPGPGEFWASRNDFFKSSENGASVGKNFVAAFAKNESFYRRISTKYKSSKLFWRILEDNKRNKRENRGNKTVIKQMGVTDVTFGNDANSGSTVSTVYLSSDWVRPDMHFTIDWFVFLWGDTINKGVESLHRGHIRVRVGAIRILIYWAYFPFHGTNFWTLPVIHFPANISPFTQRRA